MVSVVVQKDTQIVMAKLIPISTFISTLQNLDGHRG